MIRYSAPAFALTLCGLATAALAAPAIYTIDPVHTYPTFFAGHHGVSHWSGKFNKTSGKVWLDREHSTGKIDITIDTTSINFGYPVLDRMMQGADFFDTAKYPTATYKADAITFSKGQPVSADGQLTLKGITKPVKLKIDSFTCKKNPMFNREACGGDASAEFDRAQFGLTKAIEGDSTVRLMIQVEAFQGDSLPPMPPMPPGMGGPGAAPPGAPPGGLPAGGPPPGAQPPSN
jgi:polyisoprenoid-binding protein YceI